jgi:hypothetical protein
MLKENGIVDRSLENSFSSALLVSSKVAMTSCVEAIRDEVQEKQFDAVIGYGVAGNVLANELARSMCKEYVLAHGTGGQQKTCFPATAPLLSGKRVVAVAPRLLPDNLLHGYGFSYFCEEAEDLGAIVVATVAVCKMHLPGEGQLINATQVEYYWRPYAQSTPCLIEMEGSQYAVVQP